MPKKPALLSDFKPSCERCKYWLERSESGDEIRWGSCRRYPPTPFMDDEQTAYSQHPPTEPDSWCGEFAGSQ